MPDPTIKSPAPAVAALDDVLRPARVQIDGDTMTRTRGDVRTTMIRDDKVLKWATSTRVSQEFLDWCAQQRNDAPRRAPLGESRGEWQKVAEIPVSYLMGKIPADAWEDRKALAKIVNDSDLRAFRTDGTGRTY